MHNHSQSTSNSRRTESNLIQNFISQKSTSVKSVQFWATQIFALFGRCKHWVLLMDAYVRLEFGRKMIFCMHISVQRMCCPFFKTGTMFSSKIICQHILDVMTLCAISFIQILINYSIIQDSNIKIPLSLFWILGQITTKLKLLQLTWYSRLSGQKKQNYP